MKKLIITSVVLIILAILVFIAYKGIESRRALNSEKIETNTNDISKENRLIKYNGKSYSEKRVSDYVKTMIETAKKAADYYEEEQIELNTHEYPSVGNTDREGFIDMTDETNRMTFGEVYKVVMVKNPYLDFGHKQIIWELHPTFSKIRFDGYTKNTSELESLGVGDKVSEMLKNGEITDFRIDHVTAIPDEFYQKKLGNKPITYLAVSVRYPPHVDSPGWVVLAHNID